MARGFTTRKLLEAKKINSQVEYTKESTEEKMNEPTSTAAPAPAVKRGYTEALAGSFA